MLKNIYFFFSSFLPSFSVYYFFKNDSRIRCFYFSAFKIYFCVNLNAYRIFNQSIIFILCTNLNLLVFTLYGQSYLIKFFSPCYREFKNSLPIILFIFFFIQHNPQHYKKISQYQLQKNETTIRSR